MKTTTRHLDALEGGLRQVEEELFAEAAAALLSDKHFVTAYSQALDGRPEMPEASTISLAPQPTQVLARRPLRSYIPSMPRMRRRLSRKFVALATVLAIAVLTVGTLLFQFGTSTAPVEGGPQVGIDVLAPAPALVPGIAPAQPSPEAMPQRQPTSVGVPFGGPGSVASTDPAGDGSPNGHPAPGPAGNGAPAPAANLSNSSAGTSPAPVPGTAHVGQGPVDGTPPAASNSNVPPSSNAPVVSNNNNQGPGPVAQTPSKPETTVVPDQSSSGTSGPVVNDAAHGEQGKANGDATTPTPSVHGASLDENAPVVVTD